tara:strand:- start:19 stop:1386 length:1368 start_codon:yes stop_codon:yes gene_type:complete
MALALFKNNAFSTLASGITDIATSLTVTASGGALFPNPTGGDYFYLTLIDTSNNLEIVKCTARSTDTLTIVREAEGTTGRAYSAGDRVELRLTAAGITAIISTISSAPGLQMAWESNINDADQGAGKVWANHATLSSATVLYFDDVEGSGASINAFIDSLDDPSAPTSATIYIQEAGSSPAGVVFQVTGAVTSASTYSKVTVAHIATYGTLTDGDSVGVTIAFSGNNGALVNVVEDTTPQLGGNLDINSRFINGSLISDTDSTDSFGSTGVRWLKGWFDTLTAGTLTIGSGSIVDSSGAIDFGVAVLKTTGTFELGHAADTTLSRASAGKLRVQTHTVATISEAQTFSTAQRGSITALTDASTIAVDFSLNNHFSVTLGDNRELGNPTNIVAGQSGSFFITQDGTGSQTLSYGGYYDFVGGTAPTLSTAAAAVDRIDYIARTTTSLHCVWSGALS